MRKVFFTIVFALGLAAGSFAQDNALQVMTFNIRLNTPKDGVNAWPNRKEKVATQVLFHQPHLLGVQEALPEQMHDLQQALPRYQVIGVGREDGKNHGEFSAIFFDAARLELLDSKTFWLSETPETPGSKGWDAAITRVVTWGKFKDKKSGRTFFHFNTHFDHKGQIARRESAKFLLQQVQKIAGEIPVIVTGDFNAVPSSEPIQIVTNQKDSRHLIDTREISQTPHYGPSGSFNGFRSGETSDEPIDYIFIKGKFRVLQHACISQTWKGLFASDHFALFARVQLE